MKFDTPFGGAAEGGVCEKRLDGLRVVRMEVHDGGRKNGVLLVVWRPNEEMVRSVSSVSHGLELL